MFYHLPMWPVKDVFPLEAAGLPPSAGLGRRTLAMSSQPTPSSNRISSVCSPSSGTRLRSKGGIVSTGILFLLDSQRFFALGLQDGTSEFGHTVERMLNVFPQDHTDGLHRTCARAQPASQAFISVHPHNVFHDYCVNRTAFNTDLTGGARIRIDCGR